MTCDICNGKRCKIIGSIAFRSRPLGEILVPGIEHSKCMNCDDISIDYQETKKINKYIEQKEYEAISSLPIKYFISQNEAADILCISKQAFSKNSRIQRGFIYSVTVDNKKLYYKKSVEEFKRTGKDGRVNICQHIYSQDAKKLYNKPNTSIDMPMPFYSVNVKNEDFMNHLFTNTLPIISNNMFSCNTVH